MRAKLELSPENSGWLKSRGLQRLFDVLGSEGEETRVNGGAVRNSLLGEPIGDVDLSTTLEPGTVLQRLRGADVKAIATGLSHGTITAVIDHHPYEITTLRRDIKTDGRHAVVAFGRDWEEDARRRDLTMNALYCDRYGQVFDPLGGYEDLMARKVRFIGDAGERIKEDYLRILRFFRFFARYGSGRPDGEGLKASARLKNGILRLSVERVWMELKKIMGEPDPSRALLWMRTTGVLTMVLPEGEKWGIDFVSDLISAEQDLGWPQDAMTRLQVMMPPDVQKVAHLADRLRFSGEEKRRMSDWAQTAVPEAGISGAEFTSLLYYSSSTAMADRLRTEIIRQRHRARNNSQAMVVAEKYAVLLEKAESWRRPVFPLRGSDLKNAGLKPGPEIGELLRRLEARWVESGFVLGREAMLKQLPDK